MMKTALVLLIAGISFPVPAQVINSWTSPTSGNWEVQTNWSLGILPNQSQSVYITNAGWKAVAIGANTAQNFPTSMQIQDLQLASPTNSHNTLLMNFSGLQAPLQTTSLAVGFNSSVVVQSSRLEAGSINLVGTFSQGDFSQVQVHGLFQIRNSGQYVTDVIPPGLYVLTNGALNVESGLFIGESFTGGGQFIQYGGSHNVGGAYNPDAYTPPVSIDLSLQAEYDLYGGELTSTNAILVGLGDYADLCSFHQYGGAVIGDMIVNGNYTLDGGTITGNMSVVSPNSYQRVNAYVTQTEGTNHAVSLALGHPNRFGGAAYYTLSNGVLQVDSAVTFLGGQFSQYGGQHTVVSTFVMAGVSQGLGPYADYLLAGGTLSTAGLAVQPAAHFNQTGGTNSIDGPLEIGPTPPYSSSSYTLSGGTLNSQDIDIGANAFFQHTGGIIAQSGALILHQGEWHAANGDYALGPLRLNPPDTNVIGYHTNSAIIFPNGPAILRLANSSEQSWAPDAIAYVTNWNGYSVGGGASQLYFGSNSSGLTAAQLAQILFANPSGYSAGNYPAKILSSGEIVPASNQVQSPTLQSARYGSHLVLVWPSGYQLLSATNVIGPYEPVSGASSPWTNFLTKSREFFRLQNL